MGQRCSRGWPHGPGSTPGLPGGAFVRLVHLAPGLDRERKVIAFNASAAARRMRSSRSESLRRSHPFPAAHLLARGAAAVLRLQCVHPPCDSGSSRSSARLLITITRRHHLAAISGAAVRSRKPPEVLSARAPDRGSEPCRERRAARAHAVTRCRPRHAMRHQLGPGVGGLPGSHPHPYPDARRICHHDGMADRLALVRAGLPPPDALLSLRSTAG